MTETPEPRNTRHPAGPRRRRGSVVAGFGAALVVAGIGIPVVANAHPDAPPSAAHHSEPTRTVGALGDVTLDRLAAELAELGLAVEITPAPTPAPGGADGATSGGAIMDDPFPGMSDAEIDALSDAEFAAMLEQAGWAVDGAPTVESEGDAAPDDTEAPIGAFTVDGDRIDTAGASRDVAGDARAIWERFTTLIPDDQRRMVVGFELLSEDFGGAYVYPTEHDPTKWVLAVGRGLGDGIDAVLVHEFGHLLTLQATEVPPGDDVDACSTYFTGEGCALSGSTFARFVERFWPQTMIDEVNRIQETADWDAADAFYEQHRDEFVTDYATTNPAEDLAETFTAFIMEDEPDGTTIADEKVLLLWGDPAMTALRDQIRAHLTATAVPVG